MLDTGASDYFDALFAIFVQEVGRYINVAYLTIIFRCFSFNHFQGTGIRNAVHISAF